VNFDRSHRQLNVLLPDDLLDQLGLNGEIALTDLLSDAKYTVADIKKGIDISLQPASGILLSFS
jgi:hypothetical protein